MGEFHDLDDRQLERLLAGHAPGPDLEPLAMLLGELERAYTVEISEETGSRHVSVAAEAARLASAGLLETPAQPVSRVRRARRRLATMLSTLFSSLAVKIATASLAAAAVAGAGAAAGGYLPDDVQSALAEAASHIGVDIPDGDEVETQRKKIPKDPGDTTGVWSEGEQNATTNTDDTEADGVVDSVFNADKDDPQNVSSDEVQEAAEAAGEDGPPKKLPTPLGR